MVDGDEIRMEVQTLKEDVNKLRADLGELLETARAEGKRRVGESRQRIREGVMNRIDQFKEVLDNARQCGQKAREKAQEKIEQRPITTVLAAFGIGLIVGRLFMKRR